jgi:hypothetical protein
MHFVSIERLATFSGCHGDLLSIPPPTRVPPSSAKNRLQVLQRLQNHVAPESARIVGALLADPLNCKVVGGGKALFASATTTLERGRASCARWSCFAASQTTATHIDNWNLWNKLMQTQPLESIDCVKRIKANSCERIIQGVRRCLAEAQSSRCKMQDARLAFQQPFTVHDRSKALPMLMLHPSCRVHLSH